MVSIKTLPPTLNFYNFFFQNNMNVILNESCFLIEAHFIGILRLIK